MAQGMIIRRGGTSGLPVFTYTGLYDFFDEGDGNWKLKLLTSGVLNFSKLSGIVDVFLVGGGGGSGPYSGGGGGGYTLTAHGQLLTKNLDYTIEIGAGGVVTTGSGRAGTGGTSFAFGCSVLGGQGSDGASGGSGGEGGDGGSGGGGYSGGAGGINGADGSTGTGASKAAGGTGQHTTTREFEESTGALYASGGNSGGAYTPLPNTGDGAKGGGSSGGHPGHSGIVVLRNARS